MPRQPRLDAPGTLHHVMGRGIDRAKIFRNKADRNDFIERLKDRCVSGDMIIYAWALMSNHFHLLMRSGRRSLSDNMRKILTGYAVNFNRRHKRYGHLFQNRYKSIVCEDDPYLMELTRYIHLNPLRAGIVRSLEELKGYLWTGHAVIMGKVKRDWQDRDTVLAYFGRGRKRAVEKHEGFIEKGIEQGKRPDLVGGGLIRSLGGWSQVLSVRRKGEKVSSDDRILGTSEFVQGLLLEAEEREKEALRLSLKIPDLSSLSKRICEAHEIDESELCSGLRRRDVASARKLFCQVAVKKMGYSGASVARFLGVTTSAVNRLAVAEDLHELLKDKLF